MAFDNDMVLILPARSDNESFARAAVGAFATRLDPTLQELADIKTAVSEAVTNSIVHAYPRAHGHIRIKAAIEGDTISIIIEDEGCGIEDVSLAMQPFYTTGDGDERSGMGFTVMQSFMDELCVESEAGKGTKVSMKKHIGGMPCDSTD